MVVFIGVRQFVIAFVYQVGRLFKASLKLSLSISWSCVDGFLEAKQAHQFLQRRDDENNLPTTGKCRAYWYVGQQFSATTASAFLLAYCFYDDCRFAERFCWCTRCPINSILPQLLRFFSHIDFTMIAGSSQNAFVGARGAQSIQYHSCCVSTHILFAERFCCKLVHEVPSQ